MTSPFKYYVRVRYQECDAQGVVFNARYGDYVDLAITEFIRASMPGRDPFDGSFEIQVVRQLIEWKAPARFNDVLEVSTRVARFGKTSFTVGFELRIAGTADVIVTAELVYVALHKETWTKRSLTDKERDLLESGARGKIVDHAGYFTPGRPQCPDSEVRRSSRSESH
jgi:acyl-CoA thioester hydrolase